MGLRKGFGMGREVRMGEAASCWCSVGAGGAASSACKGSAGGEKGWVSRRVSVHGLTGVMKNKVSRG